MNHGNLHVTVLAWDLSPDGPLIIRAVLLINVLLMPKLIKQFTMLYRRPCKIFKKEERYQPALKTSLTVYLENRDLMIFQAGIHALKLINNFLQGTLLCISCSYISKSYAKSEMGQRFL